MASVATSNITNITRQVLANKGTALTIGSQQVAVFRIAAGQVAQDTAVLVAAQVPTITSVFGGPFSHNATATTGATNVTITLQGGTTTLGAFDVWVFGPTSTS